MPISRIVPAGEIGSWYGSMGKGSFFLLVTTIGLVNGILMFFAVPYIDKKTQSTRERANSYGPNVMGDDEHASSQMVEMELADIHT